MPKNLVIIPTYNEKENIESILKSVFVLQPQFDVLVVDDNSPDKTADIVRSLQKQFPDRLFLEVRKVKDGLGRAYVHGFQWAIKNNYDFIFEMDADFSHNPNDLPILLQTLQTKADMVIGSRYLTGVNVVNWPMNRVLLSYFASKYVRFITRLPIHDSTAGFVGYRSEVLKDLDLSKIRFKGYGFQIEMKYRTWVKGYRLIEVPIIFTNRVLGESKISSNIMGEAVFGVIALRLSKIFGKL
ncbi:MULTISPECIES: polyprenol monophosphomannose synthase [Weeksella]|uniref:Dolichyl-phosphate beta-D-mannosyltransferase n=1 Tax=Weeksella virosa (strain ATCC 43766 / DSM 16922 / JCM 21250 / CCUG 30538 / CDC 9751 / IAM 14551 / NBRC 16016 / NCTC 11634 / CL345/78) TaxID=865938 RepID=F0NXI9_WEEVC|nr:MULTISPECIES: polyprenol monophosphomannose synthase [Weeksella]ADX67979.1 Dolichyl-phosphate beta-D-mannosyltransferase [Weeksella virosa DSM 16922]MDK7375790.1 polyprenol monophosphomannose synthase [Weeksella virosa]OFM83772.1 dolichyl-phosphate beta-D-mannosyltransferase [Weeksella sp. HMSC059D05]SUP54287.1 N-glycosyltransferase [Weeksella virosa]VEH64387.1 N-glycosyltransferase [Weeksella virosa]